MRGKQAFFLPAFLSRFGSTEAIHRCFSLAVALQIGVNSNKIAAGAAMCLLLALMLTTTGPPTQPDPYPTFTSCVSTSRRAEG